MSGRGCLGCGALPWNHLPARQVGQGDVARARANPCSRQHQAGLFWRPCGSVTRRASLFLQVCQQPEQGAFQTQNLVGAPPVRVMLAPRSAVQATRRASISAQRGPTSTSLTHPQRPPRLPPAATILPCTCTPRCTAQPGPRPGTSPNPLAWAPPPSRSPPRGAGRYTVNVSLAAATLGALLALALKFWINTRSASRRRW